MALTARPLLLFNLAAQPNTPIKTPPSSTTAATTTTTSENGIEDEHVHGGGGGEGGGGEDGAAAEGGVCAAGGGGGAAGGAQHADGDGAAHQEEGHRQGRPGPLGVGDGGGGGGRLPPAAAAEMPLPQPLRRRQTLPPPQGHSLALLPPRQGLRVHDVCDDGGGGAGVCGGAVRHARAAVDQALQHLHPLLRAGCRQPRLRHARRRWHRPPLRHLRPQPLPPLPLHAAPSAALAIAGHAPSLSLRGF